MNVLAMTLLLLAATPTANDVKVEVGTGDWSSVPYARETGKLMAGAETVGRIEAALERGRCSLPGLSRRRLDLSVPFLLHFQGNGELTRVVVRKLQCPEAESVIASAVLELAKSGEYRPTGENQTGWYRGELSFESQLR
ncbi:MAG TPA: hypothetical protein VGB59_00525 [Allosphingosinicella sp.]|jgi:hypothetical protein